MGRARILRPAIAAVIGAPVVAFLLLQALCLYYHQTEKGLPANVGNRPSNVALLPPKGNGDPISFAVVGDARRYQVLETIIGELNKQSIDFLVLVGDMTFYSSPENHSLFQTEMAGEMKPSFPVFYIPGNHDIGNNFPLGRWEETYGPSQFWFKYGGNLFIFVHVRHVEAAIESSDLEHACDFLEGVLKSEAKGAERIFVFNHIPPSVGIGWSARPMDEQQRLLDLLRDYHVDYFISGDYHGFAEVEKDGTHFIVTGGGGSPLRGGALGFHHCIILTIEDDTVQRRILAVTDAGGTEDVIERQIRQEILPLTKRFLLLFLAADVAALVGLYFLARFALRRREPRRSQREAI